jgi:hypothetical protein
MAAKRANVVPDDITPTLSDYGNSDAANAALRFAGRVAEPAGVLYAGKRPKTAGPMLATPGPTRHSQGAPGVVPPVAQLSTEEQSLIDELESDPVQIDALTALFEQIDYAVTVLNRKIQLASNDLAEIRQNYSLAGIKRDHHV